MKIILCKVIGLLAATTSSFVLANSQSELSFSGEANAGLIHNSALSVEEIDNVSDEGDSGNEVGIKFTGQWQANQKLKLVAGYAYQQQNFTRYSQYDLALHQFNVDISYQLNTGEIGLRLDAARASLAQSTFLDFQQAIFYYGLFLQPQTYFRSSLKIKNKTFAELSDRDAEAVALSADVFHFSNNAKTMLMLGINYEEEEAVNETFTFDGLGLNTKVTHKFTLFGLGSQVGLNWRYQNKDYLSPMQSEESQENAERDENRHIITATWSINILDNLAINTEFERGDYRSELDSLTYQQNVASVGISYQW